MVLQGVERAILIDCVNNPILRLRRVGVDFNYLTDLILTHFHPDHVSGVPLLLMNMWLLGRRHPLDIYGLHHTLDRIEDLMGFYDWSNWPNFFPVVFHRLPQQDKTPVLESAEFRVTASPVCHLLPTIGLRFEVLQTGKSLAYSCDTEPCNQVVDLADWGRFTHPRGLRAFARAHLRRAGGDNRSPGRRESPVPDPLSHRQL